MTEKKAKCLVCEITEDEMPLIALRYQGQELFICPQHLPILIHQPDKLADRLPGLKNARGAQGHEHE
jgi:hypothetical protein